MRFAGIIALVLLGLTAAATLAPAAAAHDIVYLRQAESFVVESEGAGAVDIIRGTHGRGPATVRASTADGSAEGGSDYTPVDRVISFPQPIGEQELTFPIADDDSIELLESVGIALSEPTGGVTIAGTGLGTVTIIDEDGPARISFAEALVDTYENFGAVEIVAVRSGSLQSISSVASVDYQTSDDTATAGADYRSTSGSITFESGQRIKRFTIPLVDDDSREENESFGVALSNLSGAEASEPSTAVVTIGDDENPASDTSAPITFFHQPLHDRTYRAGVIRDFLVQTDDVGAGIDRVQIALRAKMKSGNCRWYKDRAEGFVRGSCNKKAWGVRLAGSDTVYYTFPKKLRSSKGTNIRFYTAWSRGIDEVGNVERSFERNRNLSRFEVR